MVSIAAEFAASLGIDVRTFGEPSIVKIYRTTEAVRR
jgi:hypothetical protein